MRLQKLHLENFRGFANREFAFHPAFNVIIGTNGTGKTSVLEGAAVALSAWLQGFPQSDSRNIRQRDVRRIVEESGGRSRVLPQYPTHVAAEGIVETAFVRSEQSEVSIRWQRSLHRGDGRTSKGGVREIRRLAQAASDVVLAGGTTVLPVIRYFGAGRLWENVRDSARRHRTGRVKHLEDASDPGLDFVDSLSDPFYGYQLSVDKRANPSDLIRWIGEERRNEIDSERKSLSLQLVYNAILSMLPELDHVSYELRRNALVLTAKNGSSLDFDDMSDGYRNVIAMAADIAIKMTMLNPHLLSDALNKTPGVVLIDELDLHLHPTWQRRVGEDLRRTFPSVQFICTSHSPFIVQALRSGEELIVLDGQPTADTANMNLEDVAEGLMGVRNAEVAGRYLEMKNTARAVLERIETSDLSSRKKFEAFQAQLAESISPFADNPAYQAFLEMRLARRDPGDTN